MRRRVAVASAASAAATSVASAAATSVASAAPTWAATLAAFTQAPTSGELQWGAASGENSIATIVMAVTGQATVALAAGTAPFTTGSTRSNGRTPVTDGAAPVARP